MQYRPAQAFVDNSPRRRRRVCARRVFPAIAGGLTALVLVSLGKGATPATNDVRVLTLEGVTQEVVVTRAGATMPGAAYTNQLLYPGDRGRTGPRSRTTLRMSDLSVLRVSELSQFLVEQPPVAGQPAGLALFKGLLYLFHRDKPETTRIRSRTAVAAIRGTELVVEVDEATDRLTLTLLEGEAELSNASGMIRLRTGEQGIAEPGQPPRKTAVVDAPSLVQWCLYYAAVLDVDEIEFSEQERQTLRASVDAYRDGHLPQALALYPVNRVPASAAEQIYLAALLLSVGRVEQTMAMLGSWPAPPSARTLRLAEALRKLVTVTTRPPVNPKEPRNDPVPGQIQDATGAPVTASEWLAESYLRQSRFDLTAALQAAREATIRAPRFGFAWARVAELEFSFGRIAATRRALKQALVLAPRHAQAVALQGFVFAAENRIRDSVRAFDDAIALDGALGNAWLGRGLCRIRQGYLAEGREDLEIAAALEPNRALFRSYLGKAFAEEDDRQHATNELALARIIDPADPTPWLYAALFHQQHNRVNDAVRDLETSVQLNDQRAVYRSRLLLDQDRAVRQANLASIYQDAGLPDVSVRESARAITSDYANHSAHLNLANSYSALRDPNFLNLRYETVTLSEYLLANLLAPAGAGPLSPYLSQQEYSRLFEQQGLGFSSDTEYRSSGDWEQQAVQHGTFDGFSYALEVGYVSRDGERPNNDLELLAYGAAFKQQLSPRDVVFVQATFAHLESGDVRQYFDQQSGSAGLRVMESQEPNLYAGYHHEWSPGVDTLLLAARLHDDFQLREPQASVLTLTTAGGVVTDVSFPEESAFSLASRSEFVAASAEAQQIVQRGLHTAIVGARYQDGNSETKADLDYVGIQPEDFPFPTDTQNVDTELRRASAYGYETWEVFDSFWLSGGVSFDWLRYPRNIDLPPISDAQEEKTQWSPKAGLMWQPAPGALLRGAYTRSLGGLYYDNSVRLEPSQVAGFNQAFRSLIPESVGGLAAGTEFETWGLDFSQRLLTGTYLGLGGEILQSEGRRTVGVFERFFGDTALNRSGTPETLDFDEKSLAVYAHQLLGRDVSLGTRYRISRAHLRSQFPELLPASNEPPQADRDDTSLLHHLTLSAQFAHPSGYFGGVQAAWRHQDNWSHDNSTGGDDFWQIDLQSGFRLPRRRAEIVIGLLNVFGQNYGLNPLNLHADLPRRQTVLVGLRVNL